MAAPTDKRAAGVANISGFSANTTSHGTGAYLSFTFSLPRGIQTICSFPDQTTVSNLPAIPSTPCEDESVNFMFQPGGSDPYFLEVAWKQDDNTGVFGAKEFPAAQFPVSAEGAAFAQRYTGPASFNIIAGSA